MPVERIQNVVRSKHADLYNTVVGTRHNSWRRYVERHLDAFHLFSVEDGKWRMRLVQHENWEVRWLARDVWAKGGSNSGTPQQRRVRLNGEQSKDEIECGVHFAHFLSPFL